MASAGGDALFFFVYLLAPALVDLMECELRETRVFTSVLQAVMLENQKDFCAQCELSRRGIKVSSTTRAMDVSVACWMPDALFRDYIFHDDGPRHQENPNPDDLYGASQRTDMDDDCYPPNITQRPEYAFGVHLSAMIHAVQVFGSGADMKFQFSPREQSITLVLTEKEGRSDCKLSVLSADALPSSLNANARTEARTRDDDMFIIRPKLLKDCLADLGDATSDADTKVQLMISPHDATRTAPVLEFRVQNTSSACEIKFPYSPSIFPSYRVFSRRSYLYALKSLLVLQKALTIASSARVRIRADGVCEVTVVVKAVPRAVAAQDGGAPSAPMPPPSSPSVFIRFLILPVHPVANTPSSSPNNTQRVEPCT